MSRLIPIEGFQTETSWNEPIDSDRGISDLMEYFKEEHENALKQELGIKYQRMVREYA